LEAPSEDWLHVGNHAQPLSVDGSFIPRSISDSPAEVKTISTPESNSEECEIQSQPAGLGVQEVKQDGGKAYKRVESHRHLMLKWKSTLQRWTYAIFYSLPMVLGLDWVEEKQTREVTILDNFLYQPVSDSLDFE
jgi:hypothetical protein